MSDDPKCEAGRVAFYSGEIKPAIAYYPKSLTKYSAARIEELKKLLAEVTRECNYANNIAHLAAERVKGEK